MRIRKIIDAHEQIFRVSAVIFAVCGVISAVLWFSFGRRSTVYSNSITIPPDGAALPRSHIDISLTNLSVDIIRWSNSDIKIEYTSETPVTVTQDESHVTIAQDERFSFSLFTRHYFSYGMRVYLPPCYYQDITVGTSGGNVTLSSIEARSVSIHTRGGNVTAENVAGAVSIQSVSGSITAVLSGITDSADFVTDYGNITLSVEDHCNAALDFITKTGRLTGGEAFPQGTPPYAKITLATITGNAAVTII